MMLWPFLAMPMAAALPKPEPAPVMRMVLDMSVLLFRLMVDGWRRSVSGQGGSGRPARSRVLRDGAAGHADRADHRAVADPAAGCRRANGARPPLVSSRPGAGAPGLQYSQTASLLAWNRTAVRALRDGDVDRAQHRAVHAAERLEMRAGVEHRDDDGHSHLAGLAFGAVNGRVRLM